MRYEAARIARDRRYVFTYAHARRQTAYDHSHEVEDAVTDGQLPGPRRAILLEENRRLREENRQLWDWLDQSFTCPKAKRRQFAVQAAAAGLSLQQTLWRQLSNGVLMP